uniref:Bola-like protein n=1 Tax=Mycena chlorophos TaxID=658473 RepID=A0ABQ0LRR9_MYCCL|nr:predicted protein [Mycena chlorophos]
MNALRAWTRSIPRAPRLSLRHFSEAPSVPEKEQLIHAKLTERFAPTRLEIADTSGGCGTFYAISIASQAFKGIPMVKQHQLVTQTLKSEIQEIHGLQIKTSIE